MKKAGLVVVFIIFLLIVGWLVLPVLIRPQQFILNLPITTQTPTGNLIVTPVPMTITTDTFSPDGIIPREYSCDGSGKIPELKITAVPQNAVSLAVIVSDPDAPSGEFIHWVVWDLLPSITGITNGNLPKDAVVGKNGASGTGYVAPCPPSGTHRYYYTVYALDTILTLPANAGAAELRQAMNGHILTQAQVMGHYSKQ
jgi:Raf kinase inhibitor-like YbhB/YbcL family protein